MKNLHDLSRYSIQINDKNIQECMDIVAILDKPEWVKMTQHFDMAREMILEEGKLNVLKEKVERSDLKWAILEGYDRFMAFPLELKRAVDEYLRVRREEELIDAQSRE